MKKLKQLPDGAPFKISKKSKVVYELNTLIKVNKKAVFTSLKSKITFIRSQEMKVFPVE